MKAEKYLLLTMVFFMAVGVLSPTLYAEEFETRSWTSGKYKLNAKLVQVDGDKVVLKNEDGDRFNINRNSLSQEDQEYLNQNDKNNPFKRDEVFTVVLDQEDEKIIEAYGATFVFYRHQIGQGNEVYWTCEISFFKHNSRADSDDSWNNKASRKLYEYVTGESLPADNSTFSIGIILEDPEKNVKFYSAFGKKLGISNIIPRIVASPDTNGKLKNILLNNTSLDDWNTPFIATVSLEKGEDNDFFNEENIDNILSCRQIKGIDLCKSEKAFSMSELKLLQRIPHMVGIAGTIENLDEAIPLIVSMKQLHWLFIESESDCNEQQIGEFKKLKELRWLVFPAKTVSSESWKSLCEMKQLRMLGIKAALTSRDISYLKRMTFLRELLLDSERGYSDEIIAELKRALPHCRIELLSTEPTN